MDKNAILPFLKKNAFALSCGGVAVAAVVSVFYPFGGMRDALQERSTTESGHYATLANYVKPRTLPKVDPAVTTPVDLKAFPNAQQVEVGKKAVADLAVESEKAMDVLLGLNDLTVHPVLIPEVLPLPVSDTPKLRFVDVYKRVLSTDPAVSGLGPPAVDPPVQADPDSGTPMAVDDLLAGSPTKNLCNDVLRAGMPADLKLIDARKSYVFEHKFRPQYIQSSDHVVVNQAEVDKAFADAAKDLPDQLNHQIADTRRVYLDAAAFPPNPNLLVPGNPSLSDIWFAQLSLWMQADTARAVAQIDAGSRRVADSPVKRVLKLELGAGAAMYRLPVAATGAAGAAPSTAGDTAVLPPAFNLSPTGRTSNGMYDVVPFTLLVDVEAAHVNDFINALTRGRLTYVYNQNLYAIDSTALLSAQGYYYGPAPVVRLQLYGEELFLRKWTMKVMPQRVLQTLGLIPGGPAGTAGGGGAAPVNQPDDH